MLNVREKMRGYYIPEDIIFKILSLLPAKSLLRLTTVCRLWYSIISNPQFIDTQLANSQKKQARVALLINNDVVNPGCMDTPKELINLNLPPQFKGMTVSAACSCNGLICFTNVYDSIYVWNPLTKRLKMIPAPKIQYLERFRKHNIGFDYDSISNDYKILRMVEISIDSFDGLDNHVIEADIYSSNADCWKEIQVPKTIRRSTLYTHSSFVQFKAGILYNIDSRLRAILSFDLHNEVFGVHRFPKYVRFLYSHVLTFEDSVAMAFKCIGDESVSLWTLDDVCDGQMSWIKRFNFETNQNIHWVKLILDVEQILAIDYINLAGCFLYDYKKKAMVKVLKDIQGLSALKYTESLVSLKGFEQL